MVITYHGENYFKIEAGKLSLLIDPSNLRSYKGADLVLKTAEESETSYDGPVIINHGGEYDVKGIKIRGGSVAGKKTLYKVDVDELSLGVLGQITKEPEPKVLENLRGVDILILPVGKPFLPEASAAKIARNLKPGIVIPSSKNPKNFLEEMGFGKCEPEEKLVIKKKDVKPGAIAVRCLKI